MIEGKNLFVIFATQMFQSARLGFLWDDDN